MKTTRQYIPVTLCGALLVALAALPATAQSVPQLINYQGRLVNSNDISLATGDYELRFSIWDAANGGTQVWGPHVFNGQTGMGYGSKVPVVQGWFNVVLGPSDTNGIAIAKGFTGTNRFVQIQVGLNPSISPRQQILSAPYAMHAEFAQVAGLANDLAPGGAATNLAAGGLAGLPSGGLILSTTARNASLNTAGYAGAGSTAANNVWSQRSPGLLAPRASQTAVWTGNEMIAWGGNNGGTAFNDGGRYNPVN